jgi:DNA-binding response OmpR family regulator
MARILLIDDDATTVGTTRLILQGDQHDVHTAATGKEAMEMALKLLPDVAIVGLDLPDMGGLEVIGKMRRLLPATACVTLTSAGSYQSVVRAMRSGVIDYLEKPIDAGVVLRAVQRAVELVPRPTGGTHAHSLKRWADLVVRPVSSESDLRTLHEWGHFLGVSRGTLRNWCRTARISARRSLLFARLLRAVARRDASTGQLEDLLNVVDGRTISKLLTLAGSTGRDLPSSVPVFLKSQLLIRSEPAIKEVVLSLTHHGVVQAMKRES